MRLASRTALAASVLFLATACGDDIDPLSLGCPTEAPGAEGLVCGRVLRMLQGPADEILGYEAVEDSPLLIRREAAGQPLQPHTAPHTPEGRTLFSALEADPGVLRLASDSRGDFSATVASGLYTVCSAYRFPWAEAWGYFACRGIELEPGTVARLTITFGPQVQALHIEVEP